MANQVPTPVLEARNISRHFGAVVALADASLPLYPREVLGLVGDNGAGKSTLLKILSGILHADRAARSSSTASRCSCGARRTRWMPASRRSTRTWRWSTR